MATSSMIKVLHDLRDAARVRDGGEQSDAELLGCFIATQDEAAFEAIVRRHGPMVMGVCRRVLRNPHDVDDAFQATFLVLVRKAASIKAPAQLGNWLYGVAYNTALKAKAMSARHGEREKQVIQIPEPRVAPNDRPGEWDDLQPLLDQELSRLPDKYRIPIVLCDLEGKSGKQAAEQLDWPEGTVSGRLSRGRALLAKRLTRHGIKLSVTTLAILLTQQAASASVPAALMNTTIQSACLFAAGQAASGPVAALTEGVLQAMFLTKLKMAATGLCVALLASVGAGVVGHQVFADRPGYLANAPEFVAQERRPGGDANVIGGKVISVADKGKTITIELPPLNRGDDARHQSLTISDKTEVSYDNVGANGATPSEGLVARVTLKEGTTDVPLKISFAPPDRTLGARLRGTVSAVAADGSGFTIETAVGRDPNAEKQKHEIKLTKDTKLTYENMSKSASKPTVGYHAVVWQVTQRGEPEGTVSKVHFLDVTRRGAAAPVNGKVLSVAKDANSITIATAPAARGEAPGKTVIKLTANTEITYHGVGPDGAKLTEGYHARIWLDEGSTDTASRLMLVKDAPAGRRER